MASRMAALILLAGVLCGCFVVARTHGRHTDVAIGVSAPVIDVRPRLEYIPEARVYYAPDVSHDIFFYENNWYWHSGGAWYISVNYNGPWRVIGAPPGAFHRIPSSHPRYYAAQPRRERYEPGRPPWTALRARPRLVHIPEAGIWYAGDLSVDLFYIGNTWYWFCDDMWYSGADYNGPWVVVNAAPAAVWRIPSSHPKHRAARRRDSSPVERLREKGPSPAPPAPPGQEKGHSPVRKMREKGPSSEVSPTPAREERGVLPARDAPPAERTPAAVPEPAQREQEKGGSPIRDLRRQGAAVQPSAPERAQAGSPPVGKAGEKAAPAAPGPDAARPDKKKEEDEREEEKARRERVQR